MKYMKSELLKDKLSKINDVLVESDRIISEITRTPTDEHVNIYENWVSCMGEIQDIIKTGKLEGVATNYEIIKNMSIEEMAKMNVKSFMYMNGYRPNVEYHTTDQSIFDTREEAEKHELEWLKAKEDTDTLDAIFKKERE